jgi:hypothetical protein
MKINHFITESAVKLSKDLQLTDISINEKGKVTYIEPKTEDADGMCPFWALILSKVGQGSEGVRIPKVFAEKMAKRFKIPLHERYFIPLCVNTAKVCPFFKNFSNGAIDCSFESGSSEGEIAAEVAPEKGAPEAAPAPEAPAAPAAPAPVAKEQIVESEDLKKK